MGFSITSPLLDACVLAVLETEDMYGYNLTTAIRQQIDLSESTLYPVLRRLQREGCLSTYDTPYNGRNRRYYSITSHGKEELATYRSEWDLHVQRVSTLLKGGTVQ